MVVGLVIGVLLLCPTVAYAALFSPTESLQQVVYHWLHWGANSHASSAAAPAPHPRASGSSSVSNGGRLPGWVIGAASSNASESVPDIMYERQMMHRSEVDLIASYLRPGDVYLEYGSGGSTVNFAPRVGRAYSIEHDCDWARFLKESVGADDGYENLEIRCVKVPRGRRGWGTFSKFEHGNYEQFREYVDEVDRMDEKKFDKVFIDGRARLACALKILPYLHDDSVVFVHDFYARTQLYKGMLPYYLEVGRVLAFRNGDASQGPIDEPQGLIILRRKPDARYPLSRAEIDAAYDGFDWREPFGAALTSPLAYVRHYMGLATDFGRWKRARNAEGLVELVGHDLVLMGMIYGVVMFFLRNWETIEAVWKGRGVGLQGQGGGAGGIAASRSIGREESGAEKRNGAVEPRFVETEGMKAAQARRKMRANASRA